jgi:Lon protease-like protein
MIETLGLFPLPNVVLFPSVTMPLHVFEARYRALVREARERDGRFVMALLKPGFEAEYEGAPEVYPIGCAGTIGDVLQLPDGRFLLTVTGTSRVEIGEMVGSDPYRRHVIRELRDELPSDSDPKVKETLLRLLSAGRRLTAAGSGGDAQAPLPISAPFAETVHRLAFSLEVDPAVKYGLLELDSVLDRAQTLAAILEASIQGLEPPGRHDMN